MRVTPMGQRITVTGQLRGDVYHTSNSALADLAHLCRARRLEQPLHPRSGGQHRLAVRRAAAQRLSDSDGRASSSAPARPVSMPTSPNEDSRALSFDTVNLFDLSRFPGYDRWEGGTRVTYGVEYSFNRPRLGADHANRPKLPLHQRARATFPLGTGLVNQFSDVVARTNLKIGATFRDHAIGAARQEQPRGARE